MVASNKRKVNSLKPPPKRAMFIEIKRRGREGLRFVRLRKAWGEGGGGRKTSSANETFLPLAAPV